MISPYELSLAEEQERQRVQQRAREDENYRRTIDARTKNWPGMFASIRRQLKRKSMSNQELAMFILQCGSTYGYRFCIENGINPEERN